MSRMRRVLIVEDHVDSRELLEEFLLSLGYAVEGAGDGQEGLRRLRSRPFFDLVLLDLMMPVMSGWELMAHVQRDPELRHIPVIVVSGAGPSQPAPAGARGAVPKPVDLEVLTGVLQRVCPPEPAARHGRPWGDDEQRWSRPA